MTPRWPSWRRRRERGDAELERCRRELQASFEQREAELQARFEQHTAELERQNKRLLERERFIHALADNQPALLAYWDRDRRCRFANRAYREFFGRSASEMDGIGLVDLLGAERAAEIGDTLDEMLAGRPQQLFSAVRSPAGRSIDAQVTGLPDVVDGTVAGVLLLIFDVTEIRLTEQRLTRMNEELAAARDRAEAATRAKSAFLANVSHEIRTPLNAILGTSHLLRRDVHDAVEAERLDRIQDAATQLLEVINDILDLSKIESGRFELERVDFSLRELLSRDIAPLAERARAKGLALHSELRGVPDALSGDPTRLSQALTNLLSNAVKFTEKGSVRLTCEARASANDEIELRFTVADTGIGIDAEHVDRLFDAFVQADASTTRRFGGTGLGLAITRRLAEAMGGRVGVHSVRGRGSTFWFTARVARAVSTSARPAVNAADAGDAALVLRRHHAGARVLVAEDNPVNQEVVAELLQAAGLMVDVAANGAEAIARARLSRYDLVLMDVQMPVMDGPQAARALRTLPDTAGLPILAMSADTFGPTRQACIAAGMSGVVAKPVDPSALYAALGRWLPMRPGPAGTPEAPAAGAAPAATAASELVAIEGLDTEQALACVGGRTDVYLRVLRQFAQHYGSTLGALREQVAARDPERMRAAAHSVRGAAASIGAHALCSLAAGLEASVIEGRPLDELRTEGGALLRELQAVVVAIGARLGPDAADAGPAPGEAVAPDALERLEQLLAVGDYRAIALHRELRAGLRAQFGDSADGIDQHLRGFDFGEALSSLRGLRARQSPAHP